MPRTGATHNLLSNTNYPAIEGEVIDQDGHNAMLEDLSQGLTDSVSRDGAGNMTGDLNMGSNKLTNLAAGSAPGHSVRYEQVQLASAVATAWEGLSWSSGKMGYATGASAFALIDTKAAGRSVLNLDDPNANRIAFYNESVDKFDFLSLGTGLSISGTTLNLGSALTDLIAVPLSQTVLGRLDDISAFGATLIDDADAATARSTLGVVIGTNVQAYDADLAAVAGLSSTGIIARTGSGTATTRAITGTANEITVTNGDGVSGAPTLSLPSALTFTGKTVTGGTFSGPTLSGTVAGSPTFSGFPSFADGMLFSVAGKSLFFTTNMYFYGSSGIVAEINASNQFAFTRAPLVTNDNGPTSAYTLGYRGAPLNGRNSSSAFVLTDAGCNVHQNSGANTWTIPPNSSVAFPVGTVIIVSSFSGSNLTIAEGSGVTLYRGDGSTGSGSRTIPTSSVASIQKYDTNIWVITGVFT